MTKERPKSVGEIKHQLKALEPILNQRFKVESIEIFGSFTRDEQTKMSDIDLLVSFYAPYNLGIFGPQRVPDKKARQESRSGS